MFISIFIPTGNRGKSLKKVFQAIKRQTYRRFEVIVVDYRSLDDTQSIIQTFQKTLNIRLIHQQKKGLVNASNLALKYAAGEIFVRIDDDVVMKPYWLETIYKTFQNDRKVGGVTGPTVIPVQYRAHRDLFFFENKLKKGNFFWKTLGKIYFDFFMEHAPYRVAHWFESGAFSLGSNFETSIRQPYQTVNNLEACNFAVRTKLLKKVGGFDTIFSGVGEYHEADAAFKIQNLGYKLVYNPKVYLNHCPSKEGFFHERPSSYSRMNNFITFYFRHIKLNNLNKIVRFMSYLLFLNGYYIYQGIATRQIKQFGALPGTFVGLIQYWYSV